ncbi:hypothetical protein N7504_005729 [Penicillium tannophilum]|nr:hypothetical protein N7504_005729 [Penicillium tannophilum]
MKDYKGGFPSKSATDTSQNEITRWFNLVPSVDIELQMVTPIPMTAALFEYLQDVYDALNMKSMLDPINEASIRMILDPILIKARALAMKAKKPHGNKFTLQTETEWSVMVKTALVEGGAFVLKGNPDYACWYGPAEETEVNVVVVEAKSNNITITPDQCLAYMAMIHQMRKEARKQDCTVYGLQAHNTSFCFLKLDDQSRWSQYQFPVVDGDYSKVLGILVYIMLKATEATPTHSQGSSWQTEQGESSVQGSSR